MLQFTSMSGGGSQEFKTDAAMIPTPQLPSRSASSRLPMSTSKLPTPMRGIDGNPKRKADEMNAEALKRRKMSSPLPRRLSEEVNPRRNPRPAGASKLRSAKSTMDLTRKNVTESSRGVPYFRVPRKPLGTLQGRPTSSTSNRSSGSGGAASLAPKSSGTTASRGAAASVPKSAGSSTRRDKWDLKGRIEDLEKLTVNLREDKKQSSMQIKSNEVELYSLRQNKEVAEEDLRKTKQCLAETKDRLDAAEEKLRTATAHEESLEREVRSLKQEVNMLQDSLREMTRRVKGYQGDLDCLQEENRILKNKLKESNENEVSLADRLRFYKENNEECLEKLRAAETLRRQLHNEVQDLKGNIRVFCRVRPLLNDENDSALSVLKIVNERTVEASSETRTKGINRKVQPQEFKFDKVFGPLDNQQVVFNEITQLVQSALDGYNVCIFAYGQTGSGKTFTMEGGEDATRGVIPRSVEKVFETCDCLQEQGWTYTFKASFLEIYNEHINDLLSPSKNSKHEILKVDGKGHEVYVADLTIVDIPDRETFYHHLKAAQKQRAVAATACNERSSRSHCVVQVRITGNNPHTSESCNGMLNLVDLAGSEKLKESKSEGQRAKEAKNINMSLMNLGKVIQALAEKAEYIPFRNSKLTYLLQSSLGGNSKTLMFVNVSPRECAYAETLNSLRFASIVNSCTIGAATKNASKVNR